MSNWGTTPKLPDLLPGGKRRITYREAVADALDLALKSDKRVRVFGEGVTDKYGFYGTTKGLAKKYPGRVFDTPVAESCITGVAVGMALGGLRPVVIHPRNDFLLLALDQLCNHAAKWHTMTGGKVSCPVTMISVACRGWGSAAQHSQALHSMLAQFPGIGVVAPFSPADASAFLRWAPAYTQGPVAIMLHKWLWNLVGPVGAVDWRDVGAATEEEIYRRWLDSFCLRRGKSVTLAGISYGVADALVAADRLQGAGISAEVIDVRWIRPLNMHPILESVRKTKRLVVVDTGHLSFGASGEIVARVAERVEGARFARVATPDEVIPGSGETEFYPGPDDVVGAVEKMLC